MFALSGGAAGSARGLPYLHGGRLGQPHVISLSRAYQNRQLVRTAAAKGRPKKDANKAPAPPPPAAAGGDEDDEPVDFLGIDEDDAFAGEDGPSDDQDAPPKASPRFGQQISQEVIEQLKARAQAEAATLPQDMDPEADRKRTGFHRVLLNVAAQGMPIAAEDVIRQMEAAGMTPGPRAWHALVFAYVRGKDVDNALLAARRAVEAGNELLPETYTILIYGDLNAEPPQVERACALLDSMRAAGANPAQGWIMLCKELFRKNFIQQALEVYASGAVDKYPADEDLYEKAITHIAERSGKDAAERELEGMVAQGLDPKPAHYTPVIKAWALKGDMEGARAFMLRCFDRFRSTRPSVDSFNALLGGLVSRIRYSDPDAAGSLLEYFDRLRVQMLGLGMRPNWVTQKHLCEAFIRLRQSDQALSVFETMIKSGGRARLLEDKYLLSILVLLATEDRPVDMANILKELIDDNYPLPLSASNPMRGAGGRTLLTSWMDTHMESMRNKRTASVMAGLVEQARAVSVVDDINVGMEETVADENGVFVPPTKMTLAELRLECTLHGLPSNGSRTELVKLIKDRRSRLPNEVTEAQQVLVDALKQAEQEGSLPTTMSKAELKRQEASMASLARSNNREGKWNTETYNLVTYGQGKYLQTREVKREVFVPKTAYERDADLGGMSAGSADPTDDMLSEIMAGYTEEGVAEIVDRADDIEGRNFDEDGQGEAEEDSEERDRLEFVPEDDLGTVGYLDAAPLNKSAGMAVAIDLLKAFTRLGGQPSAQDFEKLVEGAVLERSTAAARELAEQMSMRAGRTSVNASLKAPQLGVLYGQLLRICVEARQIGEADAVLSKAELMVLPVPKEDVELYMTALGGRPRPHTLAATEVAAMLDGEGMSAADLLQLDQDEVEGVQQLLDDGDMALDEGEEVKALPPGDGGDISGGSTEGVSGTGSSSSSSKEGAGATTATASSGKVSSQQQLAPSAAVRLVWEEDEEEDERKAGAVPLTGGTLDQQEAPSSTAAATGAGADIDDEEAAMQERAALADAFASAVGDPDLTREDWQEMIDEADGVEPEPEVPLRYLDPSSDEYIRAQHKQLFYAAFNNAHDVDKQEAFEADPFARVRPSADDDEVAREEDDSHLMFEEDMEGGEAEEGVLFDQMADLTSFEEDEESDVELDEDDEKLAAELQRELVAAGVLEPPPEEAEDEEAGGDADVENLEEGELLRRTLEALVQGADAGKRQANEEAASLEQAWQLISDGEETAGTSSRADALADEDPVPFFGSSDEAAADVGEDSEAGEQAGQLQHRPSLTQPEKVAHMARAFRAREVDTEAALERARALLAEAKAGGPRAVHALPARLEAVDADRKLSNLITSLAATGLAVEPDIWSDAPDKAVARNALMARLFLDEATQEATLEEVGEVERDEDFGQYKYEEEEEEDELAEGGEGETEAGDAERQYVEGEDLEEEEQEEDDQQPPVEMTDELAERLITTLDFDDQFFNEAKAAMQEEYSTTKTSSSSGGSGGGEAAAEGEDQQEKQELQLPVTEFELAEMVDRLAAAVHEEDEEALHELRQELREVLLEAEAEEGGKAAARGKGEGEEEGELGEWDEAEEPGEVEEEWDEWEEEAEKAVGKAARKR